MVQYDPLLYLPTEEDLPNSDDTPVDNEFQALIPHLLCASLFLIWAERIDWFFGIDMGVYYEPKQPAIVPDGFLSIGVPRLKNQRGRLSYLIWQEQVVPQLVLEYVSQTPGGEYSDKMSKYAAIGVLYYVIYNPDYWRRDKHQAFEVYKLVDGAYVIQAGDPVWLSELGLGIGCKQATHYGCTRQWLYWYDRNGNPQSTSDDIIAQERQIAQQERQRADSQQQQLNDLLAKLQARGINLDDL